MPRPSRAYIEALPLEEKVYSAESGIHGTGCFAKRSIPKGTYIGTYEGTEATRDSKFTLWIVTEGEEEEEAVGRLGKNELKYLNHSSEPNAAFKEWELYSTATIPKDAEITFNYDPAGDNDGEWWG